MAPAGGLVLVTGADGFIGSALCRALEEAGRPVRRAVRSVSPANSSDATFAVGNLSGQTDWAPALSGAGCIVHLAARTHVMRETVANPLEEYRRVNVAGTRCLAEQAAAAGVRRLAPG